MTPFDLELTAKAADASCASSAGSLAPFTFVMINSQTEQLYGSLPLNRALIARAIEKLAAAKVEGIVIKFFSPRCCASH